MQFLADVELVCEECKGTRYKPQVLEVRYHGKNINDVLNLTVKEALGFFAGIPKIVDKLRVLEEVGLGYLRLGQSATTFSGGEAQRMKLAAHLQPASRDIGRPASRREQAALIRTLYIFDEPTTGLHFDDVSKLLSAFRRLIEAGGSILVIEHNLEVIKTADWVIDLGPEGGERGGYIVGSGTPEEIAQAAELIYGQISWRRFSTAMERRAPMGANRKLVAASPVLLHRRRCPDHRQDCPPSHGTCGCSRIRPQLPPKPHIEKQDFATAEALLNKAVAADPANYVAWFDLGFVYNALGKTDESIAAYRKSVAAKPDVFESNLNLGLCW